MTGLLRAVAGLPQSHGGLSVSWFGDQGRVGFCLARADGGPEVAAASAANAARFGEVAGGQAEGYARLLSGAPAMLGLLATALLRWEGQVQVGTEIDGGDAAKWLAVFVAEMRSVLGAMVGPLVPERGP